MQFISFIHTNELHVGEHVTMSGGQTLPASTSSHHQLPYCRSERTRSQSVASSSIPLFTFLTICSALSTLKVLSLLSCHHHSPHSSPLPFTITRSNLPRPPLVHSLISRATTHGISTFLGHLVHRQHCVQFQQDSRIHALN